MSNRTTKERELLGILPLPGASPEESTLLFSHFSRQSSKPIKLVICAVACVALAFIGYLAVSHFSTYQIQTQNESKSVRVVSVDKHLSRSPPQNYPQPKGADDEGMNEIIEDLEAEIERKDKARKEKYGKYMEYLNKITEDDKPYVLPVKRPPPPRTTTTQGQPTNQRQPTNQYPEIDDMINEYEKKYKDKKRKKTQRRHKRKKNNMKN